MTFQSHLQWPSSWPLEIGPMGCLETSVTTNLRCVTSQKSEDIIYFAAEAWSHAGSYSVGSVRKSNSLDFPELCLREIEDDWYVQTNSHIYCDYALRNIQTWLGYVYCRTLSLAQGCRKGLWSRNVLLFYGGWIFAIMLNPSHILPVILRFGSHILERGRRGTPTEFSWYWLDFFHMKQRKMMWKVHRTCLRLYSVICFGIH